MLVAVVQTNPIFGSVNRNVNDALALMDTKQADLYVLPELFNTGYNFIDEAEIKSLAEPVQGATCRLMADWAKKKKSYVVYGFAENDGKLYNSAALVGPGGFIGLYRKVHLFSRENILFSQGNLRFPIFDLPFGKVGMFRLDLS
jgi:predicted amidohydrolase